MSDAPSPVYRTIAAGGPLATPQALLPDPVPSEERFGSEIRVDVGVAPRCADDDEP